MPDTGKKPELAPSADGVAGAAGGKKARAEAIAKQLQSHFFARIPAAEAETDPAPSAGKDAPSDATSGTAADAHPGEAPKAAPPAARPNLIQSLKLGLKPGAKAGGTEKPSPPDDMGKDAPPASTNPALPDGTAASTRPDEGTMFGVLDADQRIRRSVARNERALWSGAVLATLIYMFLIAGQAISLFAAPTPLELAQREKERRGQDGQSISVEIVPEPDFKSKTAHWQDGANAATPAPPTEPMTAPPAPEAVETPEQQKVEEPEKPEEKPAEKPEEKAEEKPEEKPKDEPRNADSPMLLDLESLVDAAAADLSRKIDRAFEEKEARERRQRQAAVSGGGLKVRGIGASGRSDAFTKSVIAALMKTRPGPFALLGRVLVSFQISEAGQLRYVKVLQSSGNSALDQAALEAIRKARFERPPAGMSPDDRTYIIDYIFG